ncbi:bestrophin family ion channel [Robbsia sp. Bb-Pol-6]|uniref:Bestrophin family ion channel n=1 Tax=Robbsia betulipollinis TaxID=2981849 RepID=A0ABT3ZPS2_9BURK|nr:bestrophin family ion channel [Robbsia betulipollinis]
MIVRPKLNWFRMLFIWHGSVLGTVLPSMGLIFLISLVAVFWHTYLGDHLLRLDPVPFSLIGIALAIFLGFRNNASYERFWEGRKLWGALLNDTRSLARQALTLPVGLDAARTRGFVMQLVAFAYSLKHQLRDSDDRSDLNRLLSPERADRVSAAVYRPVELVRMLGEDLREWRTEGLISDMLAQSIDTRLGALSDLVGGCERLSNTPIPYAYDVLLHRTIYFYCILLPFGLVGSIGMATPVITVFIAYAFMALNAIASELEEPFGIAPNDLALDAMSRTIERSLREQLGERALPPPVAAREGYLLT